MRRRGVLSVIGMGLLAGCSQLMGTTDDPTTTTTTEEPNTQQPTDTTVSEQQRRMVLDTYSSGVSMANTGTENLNAAIAAFNDDNLQRCKSEAEASVAAFEPARDTFEEAYQFALETEYPRAQQICSDAVEWASLMATAGREARRAAEDAMDGNTEAANDHVDQHQSAANEARSIALANTGTLRDVLNL